MHCCISATTFVARTHHNVTFHVHRQSCYRIGSFVLTVAVNVRGKNCANIVWDTTGLRPSYKTTSLADRLLASLSMRPIIKVPKKKTPISPPYVQ
jgi:hypothetical protein